MPVRANFVHFFVIATASFFLALQASPTDAQTATAPNEWTGIAAGATNSTSSPWGPPGVYGNLGTPATGNTPGGRDSAATWIDSKGNFWLFGGEGPDANGNFGQLNDLWEFQPSTREWAWIAGSSTVPANCAPNSANISCGSPGIYGTLGSAAATNIPGGRCCASYWMDSSGNFWLFGGFGFGADQKAGELNDLWEFNPTAKEWTWMGGSSTVGSNGGQPGDFGTLGSAAADNIPSGRDSSSTWIDKSGKLWLYGGQGFDSQGNEGQLDDLWMFNPANSEWEWVAGSSTLPAACATDLSQNGHCGWPVAYGALGMQAPGISPGSRVGAASWTDSNNNLWLFGGLGSVFASGSDFSEVDQFDLWEFNPSTGQWAWMSGNDVLLPGQFGAYGTLGVPSLANNPPSRAYANTLIDAMGNLWLFGGSQSQGLGSGGSLYCNDVWVFEPATNEWAWMDGTPPLGSSSCTSTGGTGGGLGTPAAANTPSGRLAAARWTDLSGNFWIFGGYGWPTNGLIGYDLNDLWAYEPAAPDPTPSFRVITSPNVVNIAAVGAGTPTTITGTTTVSVITADGFNAPVTLTAPSTQSVQNACNGTATCIGTSISPGTITGAGSSTLTISVTGANVTFLGTTPIVITATSGGITQSATVLADITQVGSDPSGTAIPAPTFSVPEGTYSTPQTVSIAETLAAEYQNEFIYYTTDGSTPTAASPVYVNPITVTSATTLKAMAIVIGDYQSPVSSATYTFGPAAATPVFALTSGTYSSPQSVTLTDSTPSATIYYTTDGTTPTTSSTAYATPITVSETETIQAIATASGYAPSPVASATYTINLPPPSFTLGASAGSLTINSGSQGSLTLTVTPQNGFNSAVTFACSGLPTGASCSFSPSSVTPAGSAAVTTQLTIAASASASAAHPARSPFLPAAGLALAGCLLAFTRRRALRLWLLPLAAIAIFGALSACGGGGSANGGGGGGGGGGGVQPQNYTVTVTATSGSLNQSTTITLTLN